MKQLHLTGIVSRPNETGLEKMEKYKNSKKSFEEDSLPLSFYRDQNLRPPKDLEDSSEIELDEFGNVLLEEEDVEDVGVEISIPLDMYAGVEGSLDIGCSVYTKNGLVFHVAETVEEVDNYIEYLTCSWFSKKKAEFKVWLESKLNKS